MSKFDAWQHLNISRNADGSINRLSKTPQVPATGDSEDLPGQEVLSKDIILDTNKKTWLRIYRPSTKTHQTSRLPIIIMFHGGGFILYSIANPIVHERSVNLCLQISAIIVALEYRLAPEHRLPAAYDDAVDSILWIKKQAVDPSGEPWLKKYGDFSRCFLYGTNCGGNIAFHAAVKAVDLNLEPVKIEGVIMNQPMCGGRDRVKSELKHATDQVTPLPVLDLLWELSLPEGTDRDHRYANLTLDGPHIEKVRSIGRCLVIGFGADIMLDRQQAFVQMLVMNGVAVKAHFDDEGFHLIDLVDQARAQAIWEFAKDFIWSSKNNPL